MPPTTVVYFDGYCNLCNLTVDFLIRHDRRGRLRFASLQSPRGIRECRGGGGSAADDVPDSVVLAVDGRCFRESGAVLRAVSLLGGPWRLVGLLLAVPPPLRDRAYRFVAARRYRWFGRRDRCRVPGSDERGRFLED